MNPTEDGRFTVRTPSSDLAENNQHRSRSRKRRLKILVFGILLLAVLAVVAGGLLVRQVSTVSDRLKHAMELVPQLRSELENQDHPAAQRTFTDLTTQTADARAITNGPLWKIASIIPVLGPNFSAVSEVSVSANDVTTRAVAPLLDKYTSLDWSALVPTGGRVDVTELRDAAPSIKTAADTVRLSYERMASIDTDKLIPEISAPVRSATEQLQSASHLLQTASSGAQLIPGMLGADGPRSYLVLVQNNAETRATGGIPGALAVLSVNDGTISLGQQASASGLGVFKPSVRVDEDQKAIYTARLGTHMQNVNLTPHFPTAAETAKLMWEERHEGDVIDGVIALDPVVLGHMLRVTGPVNLTDPQVLSLIGNTALPSSLTEENVVNTLLSDVYREIESPLTQDAYFASVASEVFMAFTGRQSDGEQLLTALTTSVQENRLYIWSADKREQTILGTTNLAGAVTGPSAGGTTFGVYFNDGTGAKMDYYASRTVQLLESCDADGYGRYIVEVTAKNTASPDASISLPAYVTGGGAFGVEPGHIRTNYVLYGPAQSLIETTTLNGEVIPIGSGIHGQRPVGTATVDLAPGETAELVMVFSRVVQNSAPKIRVTPTVAPMEEVVLPFSEDPSCVDEM